MRVVILGGGESGVGAAILAKKKNYDVFLSDSGTLEKERRTELINNKVDFEEGQHSFEKLVNTQIAIKSPGIPDGAVVIQNLRRNGVEVISEIEWAFRHTKSKIIAITGSNGKTTTTNLCAHLAREAGFSVLATGNVGKSTSRHVASHSDEWLIVEVSSFQLDDIVSFRPDISILLNITPDHLDRYESFGDYAHSKWRITENQMSDDVLITVDSDTIGSLQHERPSKARHIRVDPDECIVGQVKYADSKIDFENPYLRGVHNAINVQCACHAMEVLGLSKESIASGLQNFVNDPHRMEEVTVFRGMKVVNDSKATNVDSTEKALNSFDYPIVWMAGGVDKGNDYSLLKELVKTRVDVLIALGKDNEKLIRAFEGSVRRIIDTDNIEFAVEEAIKEARENTTFLFSPACASFDLFKNYKERGDIFKRTVFEVIKRFG